MRAGRLLKQPAAQLLHAAAAALYQHPHHDDKQNRGYGPDNQCAVHLPYSFFLVANSVFQRRE
jgi:hypothetical protein